MQSNQFSVMQNIFTAEPDLEFAVLIGSRASGGETASSDWDIALQWRKDMDWLEQLGRTETLRRNLAEMLACPETAIDLIDTPRANLAMRAVIAEEGVVLKGGDGLPWQRFLRRTWRELEDHYWETLYAH
jgi:predicted nucleotidyltransferase